MPHALITGASSGIGRAIAVELAAHGYHCTLVARRLTLLEELAATLPTPSHVIAADLSDPDRASEMLRGAIAAAGPVDVLVNNAGMQIVGATGSIDIARAEQSITLNLTVPLRLIHNILPEMLERKSGTIVNICSLAALAPTPSMTWYNASKSGLAGASEALRGELLHTGVAVLTVYPGIISSTAMAQAGTAAYADSLVVRSQPVGTVEGLAQRVWRGIERRRARVIYPWINSTARWFPSLTRWMMDRFTPPLAR